MDLRKKIQVCKYKIEEIHLSKEPPYEIDDDSDNGTNKFVYPRVYQISIKDLMEAIQKQGIPESEYDKIGIFASEEFRDPYLICNYKKPKTQQEIDDEIKEIETQIENKKIEKEKLKKKKDQKKLAKEEFLKTLTQEQRDLLGS